MPYEYTVQDAERDLVVDEYPLSRNYVDPAWVIRYKMGPNVIWLTEALTQAMTLRPGMRVLDIGCGRALSSIFLARELDVQVWATDLWISPSENWTRIRDAGVQDRVFPLHAEAHNLPFADGFFDAIVSLDAYHYWGTDDVYLSETRDPVNPRRGRKAFVDLVPPGGQIGIVVPGVDAEELHDVPRELADTWASGGFHSPQWWRRHWEKTRTVDVEIADMVPRGWEHWVKFMWIDQQLTAATRGLDRPEGLGPDEDHVVEGRDHLGFTRVVARRKAEE